MPIKPPEELGETTIADETLVEAESDLIQALVVTLSDGRSETFYGPFFVNPLDIADLTVKGLQFSNPVELPAGSIALIKSIADEASADQGHPAGH